MKAIALLGGMVLATGLSALTLIASPGFESVDAAQAKKIFGGQCYRAVGVQNCAEGDGPNDPCFTKKGKMWLNPMSSGIKKDPTPCLVPCMKATDAQKEACGHFHKPCTKDDGCTPDPDVVTPG